MGYFPFCTDVSNQRAVIIGGGNVALEKIERLLEFEARITVIASKLQQEIWDLHERLEIIESDYKEVYLDDADYVIAATNDTSLNERIYADARKRKLQVNVVDVPDKCTFIFPSVVKRGKLAIGVSTAGAGPQVAIRLRKRIEKMLPENIEEILDELMLERTKAKEEIKDPSKRREYLIRRANELLDGVWKNES